MAAIVRVMYLAFNVMLLTYQHILSHRDVLLYKVNILCTDIRLEDKAEYMDVHEAVARIKLHINEYHWRMKV